MSIEDEAGWRLLVRAGVRLDGVSVPVLLTRATSDEAQQAVKRQQIPLTPSAARELAAELHRAADEAEGLAGS